MLYKSWLKRTEVDFYSFYRAVLPLIQKASAVLNWKFFKIEHKSSLVILSEDSLDDWEHSVK